jgi:N-acetylmuramoyl-L-alanine amidase
MIIDRSKKFAEFFEVFRGKRKINFLVLHHVEALSANHAIEQFLKHQVSSHFLIDEKGKIFELVAENDIAYHAGFSFWRGQDGLNKNSIGIEFINSDPFEKKFTKQQMKSGLSLCRQLISKYKIKPINVVGHSDIGYFPEGCDEAGFLDRKQDPSHFFDWKFLAENGVGIYPQIKLPKGQRDKVLFKIGDQDLQLIKTKKALKKFGYKLTNLNGNFDHEMQNLTRVFNRRFNQKKFRTNSDVWYLSSELVLRKFVVG